MACCCGWAGSGGRWGWGHGEGSHRRCSGEAELEEPCKVRVGRNLVGSHGVQGVVNMFPLRD